MPKRAKKKKNAVKKKAISQKRFDRRLQVGSLVLTLILGVISSLTTIAAAYISHPATPKPETRYSISIEDREELDRLRSEFDQAGRDLATASTPEARKALDRRLRRIALDEAEIMQKYDPEFQPRYPPPQFDKALTRILPRDALTRILPRGVLTILPRDNATFSFPVGESFANIDFIPLMLVILLVILAVIGIYILARAAVGSYLRKHYDVEVTANS